VDAHKRLHGFNLGLNCTASAKFSADGGRDRTMNRPNPRPRRGAAGRVGRARRTPRPATPTGPARLLEAPRMAPDPDVRQELVARVRQEIRAGTYDTPEKLEAAIDRLAVCLDLH
jgi:hypothetical protein